MGVGCGYIAPSAGLVRSQGLAVMGCGSGLIRVEVWLGFDGCGLGFGAIGRSGAHWCARWRHSASGSLGVFWARPGVMPRGGGWLGNGFRWWRRWLGGQTRRAVWRAGLLGCCGCRQCRCADACGLARGCVNAGLGFECCRTPLSGSSRGCNSSSDSTQFIHQCDQNFNDSQMYIGAVNVQLFFMFSVRRQMSPASARRVAFVFRDFPIRFI